MSAAAGFCVAETPTCDEARLNLAEQTGSTKRREPGACQGLTGSPKPKKDESPTVNHPAGCQGRCFAHRTQHPTGGAIPA